MNVAINISPLKGDHSLMHQVRGTGFYVENLRKSLLKYYPQYEYVFFTKGEELSKAVDIVHYPYFEPFFLTLPRSQKYKTVVTVHDLTPLVFPKHFPPGLKGKIKWQIQKMSLRKISTIITDSQSSKSDIVKYTGFPQEKINVVYLAAGEEFRKIKNKESEIELIKTYNLPKKFILYVGDVTWNKNLPRLLKAVKIIDIPLVMVGKALTIKNIDKQNAWNHDLLEAQKMIAENKKVICLGFVSTEELVILYNIATAFVMPSLYEGFGLPVLESMACGCPVVTSKDGSLSEITGDAAFYIDALSITSIANGIDNVFKNEELQKKLSQKGEEQVRKFSWKKTAEGTVNVYKNLAG